LSDSRQCVFSISEISLAASRKIKLKLLADEGNINAQRVLKMQENPGTFFTVVQIGLNAVAILGGIVGDAAFRRRFIACSAGTCHRSSPSS
jgi:CBS domain containing-hemolysin-like protein